MIEKHHCTHFVCNDTTFSNASTKLLLKQFYEQFVSNNDKVSSS